MTGALVVGMIVEVVTLRPLYARDHLDQVLVTFGLILFFNELVAMIWGRASLYSSLPAWLQGHVELLPGSIYPVYRDCSVPDLPPGVTVMTPADPPVAFFPF